MTRHFTVDHFSGNFFLLTFRLNIGDMNNRSVQCHPHIMWLKVAEDTHVNIAPARPQVTFRANRFAASLRTFEVHLAATFERMGFFRTGLLYELMINTSNGSY